MRVDNGGVHGEAVAWGQQMNAHLSVAAVNCTVNASISNLLSISEKGFANSREPGPRAKGVNHLATPL